MSIQVRSNEKPVETKVTEESPQKTEISQATEVTQETISEVGSQESSDKNIASDSETEVENEEGEESAEEIESDSGDRPAKKKGGFQRKIDKITAQKYEAIQAKQRAEQEAQYWRDLALKTAGKDPVQNNEAPQVATGNKPNPDSFETHSEYVEALTDWKLEQKLKDRDVKIEQERASKDQATKAQSYHEREKSFSAKTPDYAEVLSDVDHIPISPTVKSVLLESENGPEIAYELAKNPEEYARIVKLPPSACSFEMGKIAARISLGKKTQTSLQETKLTRAPSPISTVGTGKVSVTKSIHDSGLSFKQYVALREAQIKKRRQA